MENQNGIIKIFLKWDILYLKKIIKFVNKKMYYFFFIFHTKINIKIFVGEKEIPDIFAIAWKLFSLSIRSISLIFFI